jgi:hypothetical protein
MYRRKRHTEIFSLSFLDCICCGFGAIILLFVLSKFAEPVIIEELREDYQAILVRLEKEEIEIQGQTRIIDRDLDTKKEQLTIERRKLAVLRRELSSVRGQFASSQQSAEVQNIIEGQLAKAMQELTEEMQRLARLQPKPVVEPSVGGIPVDSEYIIFIIDTSGSMQRFAWPLVQKKIRETLNVYPTVKGIQVMNDMGDYMFPYYRGKWIPDSKARRQAIVSTLATWQPFSNSSPVEGITAAIRQFYFSGKRISIYVFGDEFSGKNIQAMVDTVGSINREDASGKRRVRIHAVGFPTMFQQPDKIGVTGMRFAALMRALCEQNGGTFVGLNRSLP